MLSMLQAPALSRYSKWQIYGVVRSKIGDDEKIDWLRVVGLIEDSPLFLIGMNTCYKDNFLFQQRPSTIPSDLVELSII